MKTKLFAAFAACGLAACVTTSDPPTSWGKEGVSMLDYQTDGILCATLAQNAGTDNGSKTAGGISGSNSAGNNGLPTVATGAGTAPAGGGAGVPTVGGGIYRESASGDFANRAAMQQRQVDMQRQKARKESLRSCLVSRGYTEFRLTAEERAKLETLPEGSEERRNFLYALGTNPEVLKHASTR